MLARLGRRAQQRNCHDPFRELCECSRNASGPFRCVRCPDANSGRRFPSGGPFCGAAIGPDSGATRMPCVTGLRHSPRAAVSPARGGIGSSTAAGRSRPRGLTLPKRLVDASGRTLPLSLRAARSSTPGLRDCSAAFSCSAAASGSSASPDGIRPLSMVSRSTIFRTGRLNALDAGHKLRLPRSPPQPSCRIFARMARIGMLGRAKSTH